MSGGYYGEDDGKHRKQVIIICVIVAVCVVIAFSLLVANVFNEFSELQVFLEGFEGRQLMMEVKSFC